MLLKWLCTGSSRRALKSPTLLYHCINHKEITMIREASAVWNQQHNWRQMELAVDVPENPVVIYHGKCADGLAAAWSFKFFLGTNVEFVEGFYGKMPEVSLAGRTVYLVDFCYPLDTMATLLAVADKVILLDHHVSALNAIAPLKNNPKLDMSGSSIERSGAMLAWRYLSATVGDNQAPLFLRHVEDRDLWKFELTGTRQIMAYFFSLEMNIDAVGQMISDLENHVQAAAMFQAGSALLRNQQQQVNNVLETAKRRMVLFGYDVPLLNCNGFLASDVGNAASVGELFSVTYQDDATERKFSLRSQKDGGMNVAEIAFQFGGGGHKNAAGFKVPRDHALAKI
jgi:oligoribonuclease NrnB/cAMP/cGMP phosphodiesterase (DHH superfamily)